MGNLSIDEGIKRVDNLKTRALEVALYTTAPTKADIGVEVGVSIGYSRQPITLTNAAIEANGVRTNNQADINFGPATADWGQVVAVAVIDTADDETVWFGNTASQFSVINGQPYQIQAGTLSLLIG